MGRTPFILLLFGLFCISTSQGQISERLPLLQNPCVTKTTCRDCIQTPSCAWCMDPDFGDKPRCFDPSYFTSTCPEAFTWNPDNEQSIYMNRLLSRAGARSGGGQWESGSSYEYSASGSSSFSSSSRGAHGSAASGAAAGAGAASGSGSIVQIAPQRVGLKLRISMNLAPNEFSFFSLLLNAGKGTSYCLLYNFQMKNIVSQCNTPKLKTIPLIYTTLWTYRNPWKTTKRNYRNLVICSPTPCEISHRTSDSVLDHL